MTPNTHRINTEYTLDVEKMNLFIKQTHLTGANVSRPFFLLSHIYWRLQIVVKLIRKCNSEGFSNSIKIDEY